jgi:hypothetical protein
VESARDRENRGGRKGGRRKRGLVENQKLSPLLSLAPHVDRSIDRTPDQKSARPSLPYLARTTTAERRARTGAATWRRATVAAFREGAANERAAIFAEVVWIVGGASLGG